MARALAAVALAALAACAAPDERPTVYAEPLMLATLEPGPGQGPATYVRFTLRLAPGDGVPVRIVPSGPADGAGLLELRVSWEDWRGDGPVSYGRSEQRLLPWGAEASSSLDAPCVRSFELPLSPAPGVLGRRIKVEGRLIGVDLVREDGHSGGRILPLPRATLESLAPAPPGLLEEHLQSGNADGIFLAAAGAPPAWREHVLDGLVGALPSSRGPAREAIFAALLWLTGQTHGRDVQRWSAWWSEERARSPG